MDAVDFVFYLGLGVGGFGLLVAFIGYKLGYMTKKAQ